MISIIVPVYNVEKYLHQCVDSILAQSYLNIEVLLIDDGSTDGSGKICDFYANNDRRVKVRHLVNGGVSSARNVGIEIAEGEFISFVDSDDYIASEFIEKAMPHMIENDIYIAGCREITFDENEDELFEVRLGAVDKKSLLLENFLGEVGTEEIHFSMILFPFAKIFKSCIINASCRFNADMSFSEDMLFNVDYLGYANKCYVDSAAPYMYRKVRASKSLSQRYSRTNFDDIAKSTDRLGELVQSRCSSKKNPVITNRLKRAYGFVVADVLHHQSKKATSRKAAKLISMMKKYGYREGKKAYVYKICLLLIKFKINLPIKIIYKKLIRH